MAIAEGNADRSKHKQTTVAKVKQNTSNTTAPAGKGNRAYVGRSTAPAPQMQSSSPVYYRPPAVSKAPAQRAPITTPQTTQKLLGSIQSRVEDPGWIDYFENKINEGIEYQRFKLHEDYLQKKSNYEDKYLTRAAAAAEAGMSQEEFEERFPARQIKDNSATAFINMKKVNLHLKDYLNEINNFGPNTTYAQKQGANSGASDAISGIFQNMTRNRTQRRAPKELQAKTDLVFEKDAIREAASGGFEVSDEEKQRRLLEVSENGKIVTKDYATDHGTNFFAKILDGLERTVDKAALGPDGFESGRPQDLGANLSQYMLGDIAGLKVEEKELPSIEGNEDFEGLRPVGTEKELRVGNPTNKLQEITNKADEKANWFVNESADATWDQLETPVMSTLDALSRPLNAAAEGYGAIGAADEDPRKNSLLKDLTKIVSPVANLTDINPFDSVDDFAEDPSKIWDVVKAAGSGFANEYQGGFGKVIAEEAKRNPAVNIYDKKGFQAGAGIALDVLYDPLNFVGVGLISNSSRGIANAAVKGVGRGPVDPGVARIAKQDPELQQHAVDLWQEYRRIPSASRLPDGPKSVNEIYNMLTGGMPTVGKFTSHAEKAKAINSSKMSLRALRWEVETYGIPESTTLNNMASVTQALKMEREGIALEAGQRNVYQKLENDLQVKLDRGELDEATYYDTQAHLHAVGLAPMMKEANAYRRDAYNFQEGFELKDITKYDDDVAAVGDAEKIYNRLGDSDSRRRLEAAKAKVETKRKRLSEPDIYDMIGPRIQYDYRFTREMVNDTFNKVYIKRKDNPRWAEIDNTLKNIDRQIKELRKGPATDATQKQIDSAYYKRNLLTEERNFIQSAVFIRALEARVADRTGDGANMFKDPERARSLTDLRAAVDGELEKPDYQYAGADGEAPDKPSSWLENAGENGIDDHPAYFGRHQQLEDMRKGITQEIDSLRYFRRDGFLQHLPSLQNRVYALGDVNNVPDRFIDPMTGQVDVEAALDAITINHATFEVWASQSEPWLKDLADVMSEHIHSKYMSLQNSLTRPRQEQHAAQQFERAKAADAVKAEDLTSDQQKVLAMFGHGDETFTKGIVSTNGDFTKADFANKKKKSKKALTPVVTAPDGSRVALGTKAFRTAFRGEIRETHIRQAQANRKLLNSVREYVRTEGKLGELDGAALKNLHAQVVEAGFTDAPKGTKQFAEYIVKKWPRSDTRARHLKSDNLSNEDFLATDVFADPYYLLQNEIFKNQHGMSLVQARIARDKAFPSEGRVMLRKETDRLITIDEWLMKGMGSAKNFANINKRLPKAVQKWSKEQEAAVAFDLNLARGGSIWLKPGEKKDLADTAIFAVLEDTKVGLEKGSLKSTGVKSQSMPFEKPIGINSTPDDIHKALVYRLRSEEAALRYERSVIRPMKGKESQIAYLDSKLEEVARQMRVEREAHKARVAEYKETQKQTLKRIDEEHLLNIAKWKVENPGRELNVITAVGAFKVPGINALMKRAGSAAEDSRIAKAAQDTYNNLFRPPSKELGEFADVHRTRRARSDQVIQGHLEELHRTVGSYPTGVRKSFFKAIKEGNVGAFTGTPEQLKALEDSFEPILTALNQPEKIMDDMWMSPRDILEFVPDNLRFSPGRIGKVNTTEDLIKAIRQDVKTRAKDRGTNPDFSALDDPIDVAWNYRIALEKARAKKAFSHTVGKTWGVRNIQKASAKGVREDGFNKAIGELKKNHGWTTVEGMGDDYIFPPEVAQMVHRMNELNSPRELYKFERAMDSALGFWKATATIYNPSYWVKNGIGEVYVSYLAGVRDPAVYKTAATLAKHARGDGAKLEALRSLHPMLEHMKNPNPSGSRKAITTAGGYDATYDDLLVGYHEGGLKTGFFNNDLKQRESAAGDFMRDHGLGGVTRTHEGLRSKGEGYEDFLRMGHYIDAVKKSSKPLPEAMADAADIVRKYHFDYDDFSMFEKTAMLRAIPFYKWTRKAVPLMIETLFLHPGKVANPFKIQNYVSNELTSQDFLQDDNGYMPNYTGIAPEFLKDSLVYQLFEGTEEADGDFTDRSFGGLPLPTGDVLRTAGNPLETLQAMANPYGKLAKELGEGVITQEPDEGRPSDLLKGISPQAKMADRLGNNPSIENLLLTLGIPAFSDFKKDENFDYLEYQKESGR